MSLNMTLNFLLKLSYYSFSLLNFFLCSVL